MRVKEAGDGAVGFKQNLQCNRGHFVFLWRRGAPILPTCLPKQMEKVSCSLSCNNLISVCKGCSATTHHSEYLHTFLFFICSLSFTPYLFPLAIFFSFLLTTTPSIFSAHINLTPHSKSLHKKSFFSVYKAVLLPWHNVK